MSSLIRRARQKKLSFLQQSYANLCRNVATLKAELHQKNEALQHFNRSRLDINAALKSFGYAFGMTLAIFICLSNSLTAVAQTLWSDVGDNWAYTWGFLQAHLSPGTLFLGLTPATHILFYWLYSGILLWIQLFRPQWVARFKMQPGTNEPIDREKLVQGLKVVVANQLFVTFPTFFVMYPLFKLRGCSISLPLPSFNWVLVEFVVFLAVEEVLFYYIHRLLHSKQFYGRFHKQHHEWTSPIACMAMYAHPVEHLFSFLLPMFVGPFLMGSHLAVMMVWMLMGTFNALNSHCGLHLPFFPSPEAHDFHHQRFTQMFGIMGILDYLHGTDVEFRASPYYKQHRTFFSLTYQPVLSGRMLAKLRQEQGKEVFGQDPTTVEDTFSCTEISSLDPLCARG